MMLIAAACSVGLGCANRADTVPVASPAPVEGPAPVASARDGGAESRGRHGMEAPFVLTLEGPDAVQAGGVADLVATISRRVPNTIPITLSLSLGEGLELLEGQPHEEIIDEVSTRWVRVYRVQVNDPAAVLELQATITGDGFGAVATREHRFQPKPRPATALPRPGAKVVPAR